MQTHTDNVSHQPSTANQPVMKIDASICPTVAAKAARSRSDRENSLEYRWAKNAHHAKKIRPFRNNQAVCCQGSAWGGKYGVE